MKYFEEISNLKLSDKNLEKKKNEIFQLFSENNFDTKNELHSKIFSLKMN